jgi:hypothetical protein
MMNDEQIFELVEACVARAVELLENSQAVEPFAMALDNRSKICSFTHNEADSEQGYSALLELLRDRAGEGDIEVVAVLARVNIPQDYNPEVNEGLRIHLEERSKAEEKIGARFLYVPYQLYHTGKAEDKISVKLYNPFPVAFPAEIF